MVLKFARVLGVCCLGALVSCASLNAVERKSPLLGATRDQVIAAQGVPRSQMVAGNREILFFDDERVVLRDGRVVEVEPLSIEGLREPGQTHASVQEAAGNATEAVNPGAGAAGPLETAPTSDGAERTGAPEGAAVSSGSSDQQVLIKSVRRPVKEAARQQVTTPVAPASSTPARSTAPVPAAAPSPAPVETQTPEPISVPQPAPAVQPVLAVESEPESGSVPEETQPSGPSAEAGESVGSAPALALEARQLEQATQPEQGTPFWVYVAGLFALGGGLLGYAGWRRRQRQALLAATAASHSPFAPIAPTGSSGDRFSAEVLNKLEWKRFEELVAAYYGKTGVVAARTKSGPAAPVHIRISWKGEPRPFACVYCIAQPSTLVDSGPVQALADALAAEGIRRGYVVTTGKFGVSARDLAEEKQISLIPADVLLEKLNALPDAARAELLRDATAGDNATPSCPRCDVKMARNSTGSWSCLHCGSVLPTQ